MKMVKTRYVKYNDLSFECPDYYDIGNFPSSDEVYKSIVALSKTNREYTRKSQKIHNYINKFKLSYRNYINSIEESKNEMLKKYECDDNYVSLYEY